MVLPDVDVACSVPCLLPRTWPRAPLTAAAMGPCVVSTPSASGAAEPITWDRAATTWSWICAKERTPSVCT